MAGEQPFVAPVRIASKSWQAWPLTPTFAAIGGYIISSLLALTINTLTQLAQENIVSQLAAADDFKTRWQAFNRSTHFETTLLTSPSCVRSLSMNRYSPFSTTIRKSPRVDVTKSGTIDDGFGPKTSSSDVIPGSTSFVSNWPWLWRIRCRTSQHKEGFQSTVLAKQNVRIQSVTDHDRALGIKMHSNDARLKLYSSRTMFLDLLSFDTI